MSVRCLLFLFTEVIVRIGGAVRSFGTKVLFQRHPCGGRCGFGSGKGGALRDDGHTVFITTDDIGTQSRQLARDIGISAVNEMNIADLGGALDHQRGHDHSGAAAKIGGGHMGGRQGLDTLNTGCFLDLANGFDAGVAKLLQIGKATAHDVLADDTDAVGGVVVGIGVGFAEVGSMLVLWAQGFHLSLLSIMFIYSISKIFCFFFETVNDFLTI